MRRPMLLLCVPFILVACVGGPGAPTDVMVQRDRVVVRMSSGWPCVGFRTDETRTTDGWAGKLEGCPEQYPYKVTLRDGTNPVRMVMTEVLGERLVAARATVEITTGKGQVRTFVSPKSER